MANTPQTVFDQLHLASVTDGDWRIDQLGGLGRLTPFLFIGSNRLPDVTARGYYNCSWLAHFRVAVRGMKQEPGTPTWQRPGSFDPGPCPALFDLDTRILYFGQKDQNPDKTFFKPLQAGDPGGRAIKGAPMRIRQINFRAFKPQGESDEYSAWFLATNPVAKKEATGSACTTPSVLIDNDFTVERVGAEYQWTYNNWTEDGSESTATYDYEARLVMGDPLVSEALDISGATWRDNMFTDYYDLCPNPKNNTFKLSVDKRGLIVRQQCPTETEPGWKYTAPFDIIVANRYRFILGDRESGTTDCPPLCEKPDSYYLTDHFRIEYYNECDEFKEDKILRRPDLLGTVPDGGESPGESGYDTDCLTNSQYSAQAVGSIDTKNWEAIPVLQIPDFCTTELVTPDDCTVLVSIDKCGDTSDYADNASRKQSGAGCNTVLQKVTVGDIKELVMCELAQILPRVVTRVYSTGCEIKYEYSDLSCVDGKFVCERGREEVIGFTNCDGTPCEASPEPSLAPCEPSGTSCGYDSGGSPGTTPAWEESCTPRVEPSCAAGEEATRDPGEVGCPRITCPQRDPN